ncbi:MAG TPA: hypothetical protein VJ838_01625 [Gaiellaceae bacterium]|nr:hypothetical protein [Gaiellaceae bacterium]
MILWLNVPAQGPAESAASLLEERRAFALIDLAPRNLSPLASGAALMRNVKLSPASIEPASAVGKHPPLLSLPARTEGHRQE